jgi:hypothetical protein
LRRNGLAYVLVACIVALPVVALGCGDDDEATTTTPAEATTTTPAVTTNGAGGALDSAAVEKALKPAFKGILSGAELDCPDGATDEIECDVSGGQVTAGGGTIIQPGGGTSGASGTITATLKGKKLHYESDLSGGVSINGSVPYNP